MMTEMGIKQIGYPAFDPAQQDSSKQMSQTVRSTDRIVRAEPARSKDEKGYERGSNETAGLSNEVLQAFKEEFDLINNVELKFNKDDETGQTYIKIVDKDTGDVIREIPPEEVRKLAEKLDEMVGILFDKKV